jgi:fatty acid desaturase
MYANVPCYNLQALHEHIKHDLPHTPSGLVETWGIIIAALQKQAVDPAATCTIDLPPPKTGDAAQK